MPREFDNKAVLVTGAASGIGRACALGFALQGAKVVVADIVVEGGRKTVDLIGDAGGEELFVNADVAQRTDVEALVDRVVEAYGRLDCAHNNAGVASAMACTADYAEEAWDSVLNTNLKGMWLCMKYEIRRMLKAQSGAIVNTASTAGLRGSRGACAYSAASHGVIGLTQTAAVEYAQRGIRINAVCPGIVRTPMIEHLLAGDPKREAQLAAAIPCGRMATPEEVASAVLWLCSDAASYVTGHALVVDGGRTAQ